MAEASPRDPAKVLSDIIAKTRLIDKLRKQFEEGKLPDPQSAAFGLQRAKRERARLQGELPPLRLV